MGALKQLCSEFALDVWNGLWCVISKLIPSGSALEKTACGSFCRSMQ